MGGTTIDGQYEPKKYGVLQIDNVDLDVLGLFTSRTDKACLGDLLYSKCFIGEAEDLGRLPFVRTGRPDWSVLKWNARVLRTERTGSGQTGPAHEVGPLSSLGPARNARSVCAIRCVTASVLFRQDPDNRSFLFSLFNGRPTKCICSLGANKLVSSSNVVDVIRKWHLKPSHR